MKTLVFDKNFEILQDVLKNAEERGITKPEFNPINFAIMHNISEFEPLPRLAHLQLVYEASALLQSGALVVPAPIHCSRRYALKRGSPHRSC